MVPRTQGHPELCRTPPQPPVAGADDPTGRHRLPAAAGADGSTSSVSGDAPRGPDPRGGGSRHTRLTLVGADPHDDEDLRARKALLVLISVLILPVAALWGALYLAFGSPVGVVPLVYFSVLLGAIAVFSRTRDFPRLLRVGQVDILLRRRCR